MKCRDKVSDWKPLRKTQCCTKPSQDAVQTMNRRLRELNEKNRVFWEARKP